MDTWLRAENERWGEWEVQVLGPDSGSGQRAGGVAHSLGLCGGGDCEIAPTEAFRRGRLPFGKFWGEDIERTMEDSQEPWLHRPFTTNLEQYRWAKRVLRMDGNCPRSLPLSTVAALALDPGLLTLCSLHHSWWLPWRGRLAGPCNHPGFLFEP